MNYRYIILYAGSSGYGSGYGSEFDSKFNYNTWFISNFLSLRVRKLHVSSGGPFNMFYCNITKGEENVNVTSTSSLNVKVHVEEDEIANYLGLSEEEERYEYYLSLLERGYRLASNYQVIPTDVFVSLHQELRDNGYKNERLFKKKLLKNYGVKIELYHVLTSYSYNLVMYVYNISGDLIGEGSIYETFPDDIFFNKNVRHLVIENNQLIITDFLNHPHFVCDLNDLSRGVVKSVCVDEKTRRYIPNEQNAEEFQRLKWE